MPALGTMRCWRCLQFSPLGSFLAPGGLPLGECRYCALLKVDPVFDARLRSRYGITALDHMAMLLDQGDLCAICRQLRPLHVDHCHATGRVRGLVCITCNAGMGMFKDDPDLLQAAADYITYGAE